MFWNLLCCNFLFIANGVWSLRNKEDYFLLTYLYFIYEWVHDISILCKQCGDESLELRFFSIIITKSDNDNSLYI